MRCKKCQSESLIMRPNAKNPSATELICAACGTWQKFIGKEEIRLFEIRHQKQVPTPTNGDRIRGMTDEELAKEMLFFVPSDFNRHYTGLSGGYYATADEAIQASLDWLEQPAETEGKE